MSEAGRPLTSAYDCLCRALDLGAIVDEGDEHFLEEYSWNVHPHKGYLMSTVHDACNNAATVTLHRMVMNLYNDPAWYMRTSNGNWLDCRKANLLVFPRRKVPERYGKYDGDFNYSSVGHRRPLGLVR